MSRLLAVALATALAVCISTATPSHQAAAADAPKPLIRDGQPVDWWFVFKFNTASFPRCSSSTEEERVCPFGGSPHKAVDRYSEQFVYASSESPVLQKGRGCLGETDADPIGSTFSHVFNGDYFYVVWNDQFYDDPKIKGCTKFCAGPWGHSKGMLSWNEDGEGVVMQVTTPSWPASGSTNFPREGGNTLGCVLNDNNILVSQHFFASRLSKADVVTVLKALQRASVVTEPKNQQIVKNGGPTDIRKLVSSLGRKSTATTYARTQLSNGVELVVKPSALNVPPWQFMSAVLGAVPLRVATWWQSSRIYTTRPATPISCWDKSLGKRGAVQIATSGQWQGSNFGLKGGGNTNGNHAKIGVSTAPDKAYAIFGDLNQEGHLTENCGDKQNGRGGMFFVVDNAELRDSVAELIKGDTAPNKAPATK